MPRDDHIRDPRYWRLLYRTRLFLMIVAVLAALVSLTLAWRAWRLSGELRVALSGTVIAACCVGLAVHYRFQANRARRKRHWAETNRCMNCGYDLQGLPTPRCPECGAPCDQPRQVP